jgi:hypothetical protein
LLIIANHRRAREAQTLVGKDSIAQVLIAKEPAKSYPRVDGFAKNSVHSRLRN